MLRIKLLTRPKEELQTTTEFIMGTKLVVQSWWKQTAQIVNQHLHMESDVCKWNICFTTTWVDLRSVCYHKQKQEPHQLFLLLTLLLFTNRISKCRIETAEPLNLMNNILKKFHKCCQQWVTLKMKAIIKNFLRPTRGWTIRKGRWKTTSAVNRHNLWWGQDKQQNHQLRSRSFCNFKAVNK